MAEESGNWLRTIQLKCLQKMLHIVLKLLFNNKIQGTKDLEIDNII